MGNSKKEQKLFVEKRKTGHNSNLCQRNVGNKTNLPRKQGVAKNRYLRVLSRAGTTQDRELAKV